MIFNEGISSLRNLLKAGWKLFEPDDALTEDVLLASDMRVGAYSSVLRLMLRVWPHGGGDSKVKRPSLPERKSFSNNSDVL